MHMPRRAALALAALLLAALPAYAANQVPYIGTNAGPTTYSAPAAIIVPSVAATPGGAGCTVGATGCTLPISGTITITPSGTQHVDGIGVAGTPAGGVLSVQGVAGGTAQPISGTVTANAGTNLNTSALALDATLLAQSAKLPATLGAKTGALSLSVVPNTDTTFPVSGTITAVTTVGTITNPVGVKGADGSAIASVSNALPVQSGTATSTNGSTTVTLGGTFQTVLASSASRKGCTVQNPTTATEVLYVNFGVLGSATLGNSYSLGAGAAISCAVGVIVLTDVVNVTAPTTAHAFTLTSQ